MAPRDVNRELSSELSLESSECASSGADCSLDAPTISSYCAALPAAPISYPYNLLTPPPSRPADALLKFRRCFDIGLAKALDEPTSVSIH